MKKLVLILIFVISTYADVNSAVKKIIGYNNFNKHKNLINFIFQNKNAYYDNEGINYLKLTQTLQNNGLLNSQLPSTSYIDIKFKVTSNAKASIIILENILKRLGHYYYFTNKVSNLENFTWEIKLKTESAINPLALSKELVKRNAKLIDIRKEGTNKWYYEINSNNIEFSKVEDLVNNSQLTLKKSFNPYFIKINSANVIKVTSNSGNNWHPNIVFYDSSMNILEIFKENKLYTSLTLDIPQDTKYIKIDDFYSLYNLKRGISITKE